MDLQISPISFTARSKNLTSRKNKRLIKKIWAMPYYRKLPIEVNPTFGQKIKRFIAEKLKLSQFYL